MAKLAIVRGCSWPLRLGHYNIQEIGLGKGLLEYGWSVDVFSRFNFEGPPRVHTSQGESILRLIPVRGPNLPGRQGIYPGVFQALRGGYDVVQVQDDSSLMSQLVARWCGKHRVKVVLWQGMYLQFSGWKGVLQRLFDFVLGRAMASYVDLALAKTNAARTYLERRKFRDIKHIPVGLDLDRFQETCGIKSSVRHFVDSHRPIVLYVGLLEKRRNPDFFLEVLFQLRKQFPAIGGILVGAGPELERLMRRVRVSSDEDAVLFTGPIAQEELSGIYEAANIFLLPSAYEIFGMAVLEALYYGVPVLASKEAGPTDILQEACLGRCLDLDLQLWVNAACDYLRSDQEDADQRRMFVQDNYSWSSIAREYASVLDELIEV